MAKRDGQFKLGVFLISAGYHVAGWRHPRASLMDKFADWVDIAKMAEAAKLDMLFIADGVASNIEPAEFGSRMPHATITSFEPLTLLSGLAAVTNRIGLAATASSTYTEPYNLARAFASLDRLSEGRSAWNIVTTHQEGAAENFGGESRLSHDDRYKRAEEYVDVVRGLWDSWDDDAFVVDRESGRYFDPSRVHYLNHTGKYYSVRGPLNLPRPPQGHPVLIQAGASGAGRDLAARVADVVFGASRTLEQAVSFYSDLKERVEQFGRDPARVSVMPGLVPIVARSKAEALAKRDEMKSLISPEVALHMLSIFFGEVDLHAFPLDEPVPDIPPTQGNQSRQALVLEQARREKLTLGQLALSFADSLGHRILVGPPGEIADAMEECYEAYGADGFNLLPALLPTGLSDFIELVLPELRRRGRFRDEYEGATLRDHFGLSRPADRTRAARQTKTSAAKAG